MGKFIQIGWMGIVNDKPYFEGTIDSYSLPENKSIPVADIFKSKKEARKRFERVEPVFRLVERD